MKHIKLLMWILLLAGIASCDEVEGPVSLTPALVVADATDITRNSARVGCGVEIMGEEIVSEIQCCYGTTLALEKKIDCALTLPELSVTLMDLDAGTTYYYCFEVGNGYGKVRSEICSFTTAPNQVPVVGELQLLGQGPISAIFQFQMKDDGGKSLDAAGFYVQIVDEEEIRRILVDHRTELFSVRLDDLQPQTDYWIQGFVKNEIGETCTEKVQIRTEQTVKVVTAGTLGTLVGEKERFHYSRLAVSGPLNGTDFRVLREMMGRTVEGEQTEGKMSVLDLTDVTIVVGGESYDGGHYTMQNVVSYGMFADCLFLEKLKLPYGTVEMEEGALDNCISLDSLYIPEMTVKVLPSKECRRLKYIGVGENHTTFASYDGCLYDKDCSTLLWWPMGKEEETVTFPDNLKKIGDYAFRQFSYKALNIPYSVKELGVGCFYASNLEEICLPENVTHIPMALFQACRNLSSIRLGRETSYLSAYCLDGCPLQHLYIPVKDFLPICHEKAFAGMEHLFETCVLHVPEGCKTLYQREAPWKNFKIIRDDIPD